MQNSSYLILFLLLVLFSTQIIQAQEYLKKDTLKLPVAPEINTPFDSKLLTLPDQIGFGLLHPEDIDTNTISGKFKNLPQGLSLKQFVAMYEKDFKNWESSVFAPDVNIYWGLSSDGQKGIPFLFGLPIPVSIRYMAPGKAATKLSSDGLPSIYPIQQRVQNDMKRYIEKLEQERPKHNLYILDDGLNEMLDEVLCLFRDNTDFSLKSILSLKIKFL